MRRGKFAAVMVAVLVFSVASWAKPLAGREVLTVQVHDRAGHPLHACITVISPEHEVISFCQVDDNGTTTIPDLPARKYHVSAKSAGYVMQQQEIELGPGSNVLSFTLVTKS